MFREIRRSERIIEKDRKELEDVSYQEIKAQTEMTAQQAHDFWDNLFAMGMD